jgi:hypothetical protein
VLCAGSRPIYTRQLEYQPAVLLLLHVVLGNLIFTNNYWPASHQGALKKKKKKGDAPASTCLPFFELPLLRST